MLTKAIVDDTNIPRLAKKIVKQCKEIPSQWIYQVEEALTEIKQRGTLEQDSEDVVSRPDLIQSDLNGVLEHLYGDLNDKIKGSLKVLSICNEVNNLPVVSQHYQLLSALSRIYSDQTTYSPQLSFNIGKIFLSMSNFENFHPVLMSNQVGSTTITIIEQETNRATKNTVTCEVGKEVVNQETKLDPHISILSVCLSTLLRLSDNPEGLCKMMKKRMVDIITTCLGQVNLSLYPMRCALSMMHKASIFGETANYIGKKDHPLIKILISKLHDINEDVKYLALNILHNFGFCRECRQKMIDEGLSCILIDLLDKPSAVSLFYQISRDRELRHNLSDPNLLKGIFRVFDKDSKDLGQASCVHALLVNVSTRTSIIRVISRQ